MAMGDSASPYSEKLISEAVEAVFDGGAEDRPVAAGEPVTPQALVWRGTRYPVLRVLSSGRDLGPCTHGSGERYVRRHWYRIETTDGAVLRVYFERRPRIRGKAGRRWWLYSIERPETQRT